MNRGINSNQYPDVYKALGINLGDLGCIMLEADSFPVTELVTKGKDDLYTSLNAERWWVDGAVAERVAHVTLLYGLIEHGQAWKPLVDIVLTGWTPPLLQVESIGAFDSPWDDEPYSCIVAHIKVTPELVEGFHRLEMLPHINTYPEYKPHMTLAYVKKEAKERWLKELGSSFDGKKIAVNKINYGERH